MLIRDDLLRISAEQLRLLRHIARNLSQTLLSLIEFSQAGKGAAAISPETLQGILDHASQRNRQELGRMEQLFEEVMDQKPLRIVVVEDDYVTRRMLCEQITADCGHLVVGEADDGESMIKLLIQECPDLVLFDIHLPGAIDGITAFQRASAACRSTLLAGVAITGDEDAALVHRAEQETILAYLIKPVEAKQLRPTLLLAHARLRQMHQMHAEATSSAQALEDRKVIERAKARVMVEVMLDEPTAYRALQKLSQHRQSTLAETARKILIDTPHLLDVASVLSDEQLIPAAKRKISVLLRVDDHSAWRVLQSRARGLRMSAACCARQLFCNVLPLVEPEETSAASAAK